jgi:DNA (cytosine-5)-methyltransferase 1
VKIGEKPVEMIEEPGLHLADLFAGAGGITEGFRQSGYRPTVAVEFDRWAAESYAANFGEHVLAVAIEDVSVTRKRDHLLWSAPISHDQVKYIETPFIDVLVGGPPCQGFSPLGRMTDWERDDPRNKLWKHYVRILEIVKPKAFVLENVPELLRSGEFERLKRTVAKLGYAIAHDVLNASHYGVPQSRRRAIVIGSRVGTPTLPPAIALRTTVRDAIGDLPGVPNGENWHLPRNPTKQSIERYKCVPPGGNRFDLARKRPDITPKCWLRKTSGSVDVFGRMEWDKPAPTIRTEFFKPEKGRYLHPQQHRPITIREAARLQTFPDGFLFVGAAVQVAKQIGNAVPVSLAKVIADHIRRTLFVSVVSKSRSIAR